MRVPGASLVWAVFSTFVQPAGAVIPPTAFPPVVGVTTTAAIIMSSSTVPAGIATLTGEVAEEADAAARKPIVEKPSGGVDSEAATKVGAAGGAMALEALRKRTWA